MHQRLLLAGLGILAWTALGPLAAAAPPATAPASSSPALLSKAIADLTAEATTAYSRRQDWPRQECNYAAAFGKPLADEDLLRVLSRKLNPNPSIEAYVKWQLLGFRPDFAQASADDLRRMIVVLPTLTQQPDAVSAGAAGAQVGAGATGGASGGGMGGMTVSMTMVSPPGGMGIGVRQIPVVTGGRYIPGAGFKPTLGVINSGTRTVVQGTVSADRRYVTLTAELSNASVIEIRRIAQYVNVPILAFRNDLVDALPEAGGVQFAARLEDVKQRIRAGDPSYTQAVERLLTAMDRPLDRAALSPLLQRQLAGGVHELARLRRLVVTSVDTTASGRPAITRQTVAFPREHLPRLMQYVGLRKLEGLE